MPSSPGELGEKNYEAGTRAPKEKRGGKARSCRTTASDNKSDSRTELPKKRWGFSLMRCIDRIEAGSESR